MKFNGAKDYSIKVNDQQDVDQCSILYHQQDVDQRSII